MKHIFLFFYLGVSLILNSACQVNSEVKQIQASEDEIPYKITPRNSVVYFGETKTLTVGGGAGDYKFKIQSQSGSGAQITEAGFFSAGSLDNENLVTVLATDRINQQAFATVRVLPALKLSASSINSSGQAVTVTQIILDRQINFTASGGMGPYRFSASSGVMNPDTGSYTLTTGISTVDITVTDVNNKAKTITYTVAPALRLSLSSINDQVTSGVIVINGTQSFYASGGVSPYTFVIEMGDGDGSINSSANSTIFTPGASPGFTKVSVIDSLGQRFKAQVEVVDLLRMNVNEVSVTKLGTFQFSAVGGKGPYIFSVNESNSIYLADIGSINTSSGLFTAPTNFDSLSRSTRKVTVTDSLGQTSDSIVHVIDQLSLTMTVTDLMVGTQAQVIANGGLAPITISAQSGCGSLVGVGLDYYKAPDTVPSSPGTCTVTATDSLGNVTSKSVRIFPQIQLVLSKQRLATGKSLGMMATGGVINATDLYTFSIELGGGTIGSGAIYNLADYTAPGIISSSTAVLRVQDTKGNFATSQVELYSMLTITSPIGSILLNKNISQNFTTAGGYGNITWTLAPSSVGAITSTTGSASPSTASFQSTSAGSGFLIAKDQDGNTAQTNYQVLEGFAALPSHVYIQRSPSSGSGNSVQIDVTGGLPLSTAPFYTFTVSSSTLNVTGSLQGKFQANSNIYIAPKSSGVETIRVQDNNSQTINIPVTIYDELSVDPVSSNLMKGQTVDLSVAGGVPPYVWVITSNAGAAGQGAVAEKNSGDSSVYVYDSATYTGDGTNEIEITITDSKPGTANTVKAFVNVSSIAKVLSVSANVGSTTQSYFGIGAVIPVTVSFDRIVDVTGAPRLQLNSHVSTAFANYISGSGTNILVFNYTVAAGQNATRLDYQGVSSLQLNGGTIIASGVNASRTLATPNLGSSDAGTGAVGSLSIGKYLTIDGVVPAVPASLTLNTPSSSPGTISTPNIEVGTNLELLGTLELHNNVSCSNQVASSAINASSIQLTTLTLSEGVYDFYARQKDLAGNYSTCSTSTVRYVYDAHQPGANALSITDSDSSSTSYTNSTNVNLTLNASNAVEMYITNTAGCGSGGNYETYSTTKVWTLASGDGAKQVYFKVKSLLGTESSCLASNSIMLDTVAPTAILGGVPTGTNNTTTLNISVSGTGVTAYQYKVGVAGSIDCTSSSGYSSDVIQTSNIVNSISTLADGSIKLCVIGKDSAGNYQSYTSASNATWTKFTTLPTATISNAPTGTSNATVLNITVAGSDVTQYKYKVGVSSLTNCSDSSGYSSAIIVATLITNNISGLADGDIKVCVVGLDSIGNEQLMSNATSAVWTKDSAAPIAILSNVPSGTNNTTTLNVAVSGAGVAYYQYKVGAAASIDCSVSGGYSADVLQSTNITDSISGLSDVSIELCVIGKDSAGNYQSFASATTAIWTKDTTGPGTPVIALHSGNSTPNTQTRPSFTVSSLTASDTVKIFKNDNTCAAMNEVLSATVTTASMTLQPTQTLAEGSYNFYAQAQDLAGNKSACSSGVSYVLDLTAPTVPSGISLGSVLAPNIETPTITVGTPSTDAVGSIIYEAQIYDSTGTSTVGSPEVFVSGQNITGLSLNIGTSYTLKVRSKDSAGNVSAYSTISSLWTAQFACPTGYIEVPALTPYTTSNFCVAKYEMRCQGTGCGANPNEQTVPSATAVAVSTPGASQFYDGPWSSAIYPVEACQNLGAGYDLISNSQWQTIARNIADQASNWGTTENGSNATVAYGNASLSSGHSDQSPMGALNATDDSDPCYGTGQTCSQSNWSSQRRTHVLSNGNVIWDFSGNLYETVSSPNLLNDGSYNYASLFNASDIKQINYGNDEFCTSPSTGRRCGFGMGYFNFSDSAATIVRGGSFQDGSNVSGVFFRWGGGSNYTMGFRCVYQP